ncbi:MAG: hypothetical protein ACKOYJ_01840 [Planctomycetia bacterium]
MTRDDLERAIDLALAGDWDGAHGIVQQDEADRTAAWIHAVLHKIERDLGNARYWYGRAGRPADIDRDSHDELRAIKESLPASAGPSA